MTEFVAYFRELQWPEEQIAFMAEFVAQTRAIPGSTRRLWNDQVEIEFTHANLGVCLDLLEARTPFSGHGVKALDWLKQLANKHQVSIFADAEPINDNGITGRHELKSWYVKHGFTKNGGQSVRYFPV